MERLSDSHKPLGGYDRVYPPHFDAPDYGQALTFRLADSMPKPILDASFILQEPSARFWDGAGRLDGDRLAATIGIPGSRSGEEWRFQGAVV